MMRVGMARLLMAALVVTMGSQVLAHEMIVKGTVAAVEAARLQVKTGQEKAGVAPAWYPLDAATKIKRGETVVSLSDAHIAVDERVVLIVDHPDKGPMKTKEIRLAAR